MKAPCLIAGKVTAVCLNSSGDNIKNNFMRRIKSTGGFILLFNKGTPYRTTMNFLSNVVYIYIVVVIEGWIFPALLN
jgi:hypothetical protein